jgi:branched-chain amino acid transport system permease protein
MFLLGLIMARAIVKPILGAPSVAQIFATAGLSIVIQNIALFLWGADYRTIKTAYSDDIVRLGFLNFPLALLIAFGVAMAITALLLLFLRYTYLGRAMRAVAQDRQAAYLMSINVDFMDFFTFSLGISLAGIAGTLMMPIYPVFPTVGATLVIIAFVVVVLGGLGSMGGALIGGLVIGVVETLSGFLFGTALRQIVYFVVFIFVLVLIPAGFFGQRGAEEVGFK